MRYQVIRQNQIGIADHGWLQARHYFSFANYYNPQRMGFGALRVINDDSIAPSRGFGTHPHQDMEIITIPLSGSVRHEDSEGNKGLISPGEVQVMSAGTGIYHSEHNGSANETLNLFQVWIIPDRQGVKPRYDQKRIVEKPIENTWIPLISPIKTPIEGSLQIYQDAYIHRIDMTAGHSMTYNLKNKTHGVFILVVDGEVRVGMEKLTRRDAVEMVEADSFDLNSIMPSQVLVLEVPLISY